MYRRIEGLVCQRLLVDMITEDSQSEDSKGEEVASFVRASEDACEDVGVILCSNPRC